MTYICLLVLYSSTATCWLWTETLWTLSFILRVFTFTSDECCRSSSLFCTQTPTTSLIHTHQKIFVFVFSSVMLGQAWFATHFTYFWEFLLSVWSSASETRDHFRCHRVKSQQKEKHVTTVSSETDSVHHCVKNASSLISTRPLCWQRWYPGTEGPIFFFLLHDHQHKSIFLLTCTLMLIYMQWDISAWLWW